MGFHDSPWADTTRHLEAGPRRAETPESNARGYAVSRAKQPSAEAATSSENTLLYGLSIVGALASGWAIFLWHQLMVARSGAKPFCGFGDSGDCAVLWDAEFAARVHDLTGLPVAGWGVAWGIAATLLPLFAVTAHKEARAPWIQACRLMAWLAVLGVVGLLVVSAQAGLFCVSCSVTYVLSLAYAGGAIFGLPKIPRTKAWLITAGALGIAWLALLWPGSSTPKNLERAGQKVLAASSSSDTAGQVPTLEEFIAGLDDNLKQGLSDTLAMYRAAPEIGGQPGPRNLVHGDASAPVLITEFTDTLCGHCATLHGNLAYLEATLPAHLFAVDARHFPLDGNCNPHLEIRGPESVRCVAAKARICLAEQGHDQEYSGALYQNQRQLSEKMVYDLAAPFTGRDNLSSCIESPRTAEALASDVDFAWLFEPGGTPLVLVNGRQGNAFGPFLYAMILSGGDADHTAFSVLPPFRPEVLTDPHAGHNH